MPKIKKEESAKKKRLAVISASIGEPENIFDESGTEAPLEVSKTHAEVLDEAAAAAESSEETAEKKVKAPKVKGKKYIEAKAKVGKNKKFELSEAIELVKKTSYSKFDGTVEAHFTLADKELRGTISLPNGTGKTMKVVALVPDAKIKEATDAGADFAGGAEIAEKIKKGEIVAGKDFNAVIADPSTMALLAPLAKILGPKGMMPNPKNGTVGPNVAQLVTNLKKGQLTYKAETPNPYLIHMPVGKVSFKTELIVENIQTATKAFGTGKVRKMVISATMAPGVEVEL